MIGFVIVSHSAAVAAGVRDLARQLVRDRVPIAIAGGVDDPSDPIGTDPLRILAAIEAVYSEDGVVVFMDLGSAVLSAETALDFLTPDQRAHVHLCGAPLVEGVLAAAVQAMAGSSLAEVLAEADGALNAKAMQLHPMAPQDSSPQQPPESPNATAPFEGTDGFSTVVTSPLGLHARPAARIVNTVSHFDAQVTITNRGQSANAGSINQIMTLVAQQGDTLHIGATGPQAREALAAMRELAAANFHEANDRPTLAQKGALPLAHALGVDTPADLYGAPVVEGVSYGPAFVYHPVRARVREETVADPPSEWARLQQALASVHAALTQLQAESEQRIGAAEAMIFSAEAALLADPDLQQLAQDLILDQHLNAEAAWRQVTDAVAQRLEQAQQSYWQQRTADIYDVQTQVLRQLMDAPSDLPQLTGPAVLVAEDLPPSVTVLLRPEHVRGIVLERGGATSHTAILARAMGIPTVMGASGLLNKVTDGQLIALDGFAGRVWLHPTATLCAQVDALRQRLHDMRVAGARAALLPAQLRDGKRIRIMANIGGADEAAVAVRSGAEGIGLFRTEYLFMNRPSPPDEAEQYAAYVAAAAALDGEPLVVRTLDVGGDKAIAYLGMPAEGNPALGWRGIRYWLARPELATVQLRAILRAGAGRPLRLLAPMVSTVEELLAARSLIEEVCAALRNANLPCAADMPVGVMVETPAAVFMAHKLAPHVDFFSIGTNDLTQYVMAADRNNVQVATLANHLQPAVFQSIHHVVQAAHQAGIRVAVCGELAGDPNTALLLAGLGVDELSMNAAAIPAVKAALRRVTLGQTIALAEAVLGLTTVEEIEQLLGRQNLIPP